ncbi:MAG: UDP-glucose/GDP-mannose dehydrogenase family protein [Gemmatimonadota bacterium]|nr:UDP-glucose/GDP-mannose dehydrogenase family protein [Gemmatimonadota bacterium]
MRVCVIGTGYVGLVSGACLADLGHEVRCVDLDPERVEQVNRGVPPIHEEGLAEILERQVGRRLTATTDLAAGFAGADLVLVCVGTPFDGRRIDLRAVLAAAEALGACLRERSDYCVIAVKSTVIPGTTMGAFRVALERTSGKRAGVDFGLGMNPEFLAEGVAVHDFRHPDRIVVGGIDSRSLDTLAALYQPLGGVPIIRTSPTTAEMIKYASNALLATLISFSNEIGNLCEVTDDVDVAEVLRGVHAMKHLTYQEEGGQRRTVSAASFLWAGCGFGGSCFPKDVRALVAFGEEHGQPQQLLEAVVATNAARPERLLRHLRAHVPNLTGLRVAVLGLAFKPGTDDVRESPALPVVAALLSEGAVVTCHDPIAVDNFVTEFRRAGHDPAGIGFATDLAAAVADAQAVLLITSWPGYDALPGLLAGRADTPLLVDGRRFIARDSVARYAGIGIRPTPAATGPAS